MIWRRGTGAAGSNDNMKVLINTPFRLAEGNIDERVVCWVAPLGYQLTRQSWESAMNAISDAVRVTGSRTLYPAFYETGQDGESQRDPP